jgi:hypothetical protein
VQKQLNTLRKSAFGGIVHEEPIHSSELDVDIGEFLHTNTSTINDVIQRALDEHM